MLELGMVSSFRPHSMCKRVERVTAKTGRTSCTNWTISFGVSGFRTRTHLLHGHFIFLNLLQLQTFLRSVHTIQSDVINFQHALTSFVVFQSFKLQPIFAFSMHHSKRRHQFPTRSDIICC